MDPLRYALDPMKAVLGSFLFFLIAESALAGLDEYHELVVRDSVTSTSDNGIRVTSLGVNGYQLEADGRSLLIDPYFSRVALWPVALNRPISPSDARIGAALPHLNRTADAI